MKIGKDIERYDWYYDPELFTEVIIDRLETEQYRNSTRICELLNQQAQRISELEEQLKNAIVPKFKVGQEIYIVCDPNINKIVYGWKIVDYEYYKQQYIVENKDSIDWLREDKIFATREEAEQKLAEIG